MGEQASVFFIGMLAGFVATMMLVGFSAPDPYEDEKAAIVAGVGEFYIDNENGEYNRKFRFLTEEEICGRVKKNPENETE